MESKAFGSRWLEWIFQDARFAFRQLSKAPGFSATAIAILALAIGVNTATFTVINATLFRGFRSVDRNERLLYIHAERNGKYSGVSYPDFESWRNQAKSFVGMGAVADVKVTLDDEGDLRERFTATRITADGFRLLGRKPLIGRVFLPTDEAPDAQPVAVLSYGFWARRFGSDPSILGRTLKINGSPQTTVIGVMPEGFSFPQNQDFWLPLMPTADQQKRDDRSLWFAFGRLADGATKDSARAELEIIGKRLADAYPESNAGQVPRPHTFAEFFIGPNSNLIYGTAWGAVAFVLLIGCANVSNLMLARTITRWRELSIRVAMGAGRWRIVRQLLTESIQLSICGGLVGWWIARGSVHVYAVATNPAQGEWRRDLLDYSMDYRVFAYIAIISIGTGLMFALAPALRFAKLDLNSILKGAGRGATAHDGGKHLSRLLVTAEVALAVILVSAAGLMTRSFLNIYTADVGAKLPDIRTALLRLPEVRSNHEVRASLFDRLRARLQSIPGVESVSLGDAPASGIPPSRPYELAAQNGLADETKLPLVTHATIGPNYFRTVGATVVSGRDINEFDRPTGLPVALVNRRFANEHWPSGNALGQRLRLINKATPGPWLTVVGVVSDIIYDPSRQRVTPVVYIPYAQSPDQADMWVLIRSSLQANEVATAFRHEIAAVDPGIIVWLGPYNLDDRLAVIGGPFGNIRSHAALFVAFAAIALLLATVGLYAIVAHSVKERVQEIGIRMALGARGGHICTALMKLGILPVAVGLIIGLAGSLALSRLLAFELVGVPPDDLLTLILTCAVLFLSAVVACLIPMRGALRTDPATLLRG